MARYIDADALKRKLIDEKSFFPAMVARAIDDTPTADVVEVVRCKDCKYCFDAIMGGMWCEHPDNIMPLGSNPRDYCSYGERREGQ